MPYDAIVIGGRIAGSATATLLARAGRRVLVVDRATFPSDTISTQVVWQRGVNYLIDWSLGDRLAGLGSPAIDTLDLGFGAFSLSGAPPAVGRAVHVYAPRRTRLDKMLVDAAREAGAEVREGFAVDEILADNGRVTGIRGREKSGTPVTERATVVIGADGVHSTVARAVQAPEYNVQPRLACWYYSYWSGIRSSRIRFFALPGNCIGCIPTNDGLCLVAAAWPLARFSEVKQDVERQFHASLERLPAFHEEVRAGKREERFYGTGDLPHYFRKPYGPGWALVGDAGYHKDPVLASGISDALRDSALLAAALEKVWDGRESWEAALGGYEAARNRASDATYAMNVQFAAMEPPPPEIQALLAALRGRQEDTDAFLGTMTGAVPVEQFYAPDNVARIRANAAERPSSAMGA
jgi:flavin-dependent dehydrogenase